MVRESIKHPKRITNFLRLYRKKSGLSQKEVASLMGFKTTTSISRYESGLKLPSLINLLKLETIYRTPVAFLFRDLCENLKKGIRQGEEKIKNGEEKQESKKCSSKK